MRVLSIKTRFRKLGYVISCLIFVAIAAIAYFNIFAKPQSVIAKAIKTLPNDDREALEWLFLCLHQNSFPYVLFGNKPMSICSFLEIEPADLQIHKTYDFIDFSMGKLQLNNLMGIKGWETWKKYRSIFPSSNFILLENHDRNELTIVMINKSAFLKVVKENISDFKNALGVGITPEALLGQCIKSKNVFGDVLKYNHALLGMLLGYGRHNALLFARRHQIDTHSPETNALDPSTGFSNLEEEYQYINGRLKSFDECNIADFNPLLLTLPMFVADQEHPETQQLRINYTKQYRNIVKQYKKGSFLEITLKQLCSSCVCFYDFDLKNEQHIGRE